MIVSALRTPFGKLGGGLAARPATELGAIVIRAALDRVGIEPGEPQYAIMGQVLQAGAGQAPARQAAVAAGLPVETPADTVNKVCASSIRAIEIADAMIRAGDVDVVVTGGMESMSNAPYLLTKARFGYRLGNGDGATTRWSSTGSRRPSTACTWSSRTRWCPASSGSHASARTNGRLVRTCVPQRRRPRAASPTSSYRWAR